MATLLVQRPSYASLASVDLASSVPRSGSGHTSYSSSQHSLSYYYDNSPSSHSQRPHSVAPPSHSRPHSDAYLQQRSTRQVAGINRDSGVTEHTRLVPPTRNYRQSSPLQELANQRIPQSTSYRSIPNTAEEAEVNNTSTKSVFTNIKRSKSKRLRSSPLIRNNSIISTHSIHSNSLPLPDFQASSTKTKNLAYSWRLKQQTKRRSIIATKTRKSEEVSSNYQNSKQLYSIYKMLSNEDLPISYLPQYLLEYSVSSKDILKRNPPLRYQIKKCNFYGHKYQVSLSSTDKTIFDYYNIPKSKSMDYNYESKRKHTQQSKAHKHSKTLSGGAFSGVINYSNQDISEARDKYDLKTENNRNKKSIRFSEIPDKFIRNSKYGEISNISDTDEVYITLRDMVFSQRFTNTKDLLRFLSNSSDVANLVSTGSPHLVSRLMLEIYLRRVIAAKMAIKIGILKSRSSMWGSQSSGYDMATSAGSRQSAGMMAGGSTIPQSVSSGETRLRFSESDDEHDERGSEYDSDIWGGLIDMIKSVYGSQQTDFFTDQL